MFNILLITCSSGHGHIVATNNIRDELAISHPDAIIHTLDTVNYLYPVKPFVVDLLNAGIRRDSFLAHALASGIGFYEFFYDYLFGYPLSRDIHALFKANNIDTVIDTQPVFTPFLVRKIASASKKPVAYHKVLTDLPTNETHPCYTGIRKRGQFEHVQFYVHSNPPLLDDDETGESFWRKHCHLELSDIRGHWGKPVHPAFKTVPKNTHIIGLNIHPTLASHLNLPSCDELHLPPQAQVTTVMMGSQGLEAIEQYVDQIERQFHGRTLDAPQYFFIACSRNETLFQQLLKKCLSQPADAHMKIIPLEMQSSEHVASMMWRSQTILLRSSGLSCMEQLAMNEAAQKAGLAFSPKRYLHSHCKRPVPTGLSEADQSAFLLSHSIGYEKGNAIYMHEKLGALLTRPDLVQLSR